MQNKPHSLTVKNVSGKWQDLPMALKKCNPVQNPSLGNKTPQLQVSAVDHATQKYS